MRKQGFTRTRRMTERSQFVRLFDQPKVYRAATFQAFWKESSSGPRLGITLKGRLSSVWRMRIKRIVREWFRLRQESFGLVDLNIVIKVPARLDYMFVDRLKDQLAGWNNMGEK